MNADFRSRGWWRDETALDDLRRASRATPGKGALICYRDGEPETVTYAQLASRVERMASNLHRLGVRPHHVVTLQLPNSWQLVALCLACSRVGAIPAPVLPIMRRREVEFMLRLTASAVYIADAEFRGFSYADMSAELAAAVPTLRTRLIRGETKQTALDFDRELLEHEPPDVDLDALEAKADDPAQLMFTSGTTGEPKGVLHSHNTLYWMNRAQADALRLDAAEVTAMGSPTSHQAGYTWNFLMPLLLGATAVQTDVWDPQEMLGMLERHRVTFFMGAPTFLHDLIEAQKADPHDLSWLGTFATGSAPIAPMLVEGALDVLGCRLYSLWGMTENGCVTVTRPEDPVTRASESDGSVIPGTEVRIVASLHGGEVPAGQPGRLQVRGASQCLGYFKRPQLYRESVTEDGWFDTGDLARDDGHGGIRITGRIKDLILRGGENVPAVEVEAALLRHPAVRDVAVVGYPDDRLGERACAVVVVRDPQTLTLDDLRVHLAAAGMSKHYWPERLELTGALPRTPSGKVQRIRVRERLAAIPEPRHAL